jgi:Ca2+-binding RTX toxin-like protein
MAITTQDYAFLSDMAYKASWEQGQLTDLAPSGERYTVLEFITDASGYKGVIFKSGNGDIVVAHCGTEFETDKIRDLLQADGQMGTLALNQQIFSARWLVERALDIAAQDPAHPTVTLTGHSLGGALTQMTAFKYGLYGETFNSYGAVGIEGLPAGGGDAVVNHIRVTDMVAALGVHYGKVIAYATEEDYQLLLQDPGVLDSMTWPWPNLSNLPELLPDVTHSVAQFYGSESIVTSENIARYEESQAQYEVYRAQLLAVAKGLPIALDSAQFVGLPQVATFYDALTDWLTLSYRQAEASAVFLGTTGVDIRTGTDKGDFLGGLAGADRLSGGMGRDLLKGGSDGDTLRGDSGNDQIFGDEGDDYLDGGTGDDLLYGGTGNDRYDFRLTDFQADPGSTDQVYDADGLGQIEINSVALSIGDQVGGSTWKSLDGKFTIHADLSKSVQKLYIQHTETGSRIVINNWHNGDLGITLKESQKPAPQPNAGVVDGLFDQPGDEDETLRSSADDVVSGSGINDAIDGGLGNDTIHGGGGNNLLLGGAGDNEIRGGEGNDFVFSSSLTLKFERNIGTSDYSAWFNSRVAGKNYIAASGNGWYIRTGDQSAYDPTQANGGNYIFELYTAPGTDTTLISSPSPNEFANGVDTVDAGGGNDFVSTSEGDDVINGGSGNDVLLGGADNDFIKGGADNDFIWGDATALQGNYISETANVDGHDVLQGEAGNDVVFGGRGNDDIDGGADNDKLYGDGGNDRVIGGDGDDYLEGDKQTSSDPTRPFELDGADYLDGGAGNDLIHGGGGDDTILGGTGNDQIDGDYDGGDRALDGDDLVRAGDGNDRALGGGGNDTLYGDDGNDELFGDSSGIAQSYHGNDTLYGGAGVDKLWGQGGDDRLSGGMGNDLLDGSTGNDSLSGDDGDDELFGGQGNDTLSGGNGNDRLEANAGDDNARGEAGNDLIFGHDGNDRLDGGAGVDHIEGGTGNDSVSGGADNDYLYGDDGNDVVDGGAGSDMLLGDKGNDQLFGGDGDDQLDGGEDADLLLGGRGNDMLAGGDGDDVLQGEAGDDQLVGGAGQDRIIGGLGNDVLLGGSGSNVFVFGTGDGADIILGGAAVSGEVDRVELSVIDSLDDAEFAKIGNDLRLVIPDTGDTLYIRDFFNGRGYQVVLSGGASFSESDIRNLQGLTVVDLPQAPPLTQPTTTGDIYGSGGLQITGTVGADSIYGTSGNDTISGEPYMPYTPYLGGNDVIRPGAGNDTISGGAGNDWIILDRGFGTDTVNLDAGGTDTIQFNFGFGPNVRIGFERYVGLVISFLDSPDKLIIGNAGPYNGADFNLKFNDGTTLTGSELVAAAEEAWLLGFYFGHTSTVLVPSTFGGLPSFDPWLNEGNTEDAVFGQGADYVDIAENHNFTMHLGGGSDHFSFIGSGSNVIFGDDPRADWFFQGNDQIIMKSEDPTRTNSLLAFGMGGNDLIYGGTSQNGGYPYVVLGGGDGADTLYGRPLNTTAGTIYFSTLDGGRGDDTLYSGGAANAYGGQGNDVFYGGQSWDTFVGGEGNDTAFGGGGGDTLHGNDGNDVLNGGDGDDTIQGEDGDDFIDGGAGNDFLRGQSGNNTIRGGEGDDIIYSETTGIDVLLGDGGNDKIYSWNTAAALIDGGDGNDEIHALATSVLESTINGGAGNDQIFVTSEWYPTSPPKVVTIDGGSGDDEIQLYQSHGPSVLTFAPGSGHDTVVMPFSPWQPESATVRVELHGVTPEQVRMYRDDMDLVVVYGENDSLRVSDYFGQVLPVGQYSTAGSYPRLEGIIFDNGTVWTFDDFPILPMDGGEAAEYIGGTQGADLIHAGGGDDRVFSGRGNDVVFGEQGDDNLNGDAGDDSVFGGEGNDYIRGGDGNDLVEGGDGNDILQGGSGTDVLRGGAGDDDLWNWNDTYQVTTFEGGTGNDVISGTAFDDIYIFNRGDGQDEMWEWDDVDSTPAHDVLSFGEGIDPADIYFERDGVDLILRIVGTSDSITWKEYFIRYSSEENPDGVVSRFDEIRFHDGTVWLAAEIAQRLEQNHVSSELMHYHAGAGGNSTVQGTSFGDYLGTGDGSDALYAQGGNDTLNSRRGADMLDGGSGDDLLQGGAQGDTYVLRAGSGTDRIVDAGELGDAADIVRFEDLTAADVRFVARVGNDLVIGYGVGDQITIQNYFGSDTSLIEEFHFAGGGVWTATDIQSRVVGMVLGTAGADTLVGPTDAASVLDGGAGDDTLQGGALGDVLLGGMGNDALDGGLGADRMNGGTGDDSYVVDKAGDLVEEFASEGSDTVVASVSYALGANLEHLTLTGSAALSGTGNALDNVISGNASNNVLSGLDGSDTLDGMAGNDRLVGGRGNDTYVVDASEDVVVELAGEGVDTVLSSVSYTLGSNVENLSLTGTANLNGTGNTLDNVLVGNSGNNTLNGGKGADSMSGGLGNDVYVVEDIGDVVTELAGGGVDRVNASISYVLGDEVENLTLTGTASINGTGNALNNTLTGNAANNVLNGGAGDDSLNGGAGADTLVGGSGNDLYTVDDAGDTVVELAGEGTDRVNASISCVLGDNVENLTLIGTMAIDGTGNALNNVITGNAANNVLNGGEGDDNLNGGLGDDTLVGGVGNDRYTVDSVDDVVVELAGEGTDSVYSSLRYLLGDNIENLVLTGTGTIDGVGNALANHLTGNAGDNVLVGGDGNDVLSGGAGTDRLLGGLGNDNLNGGAGDDVMEGGQGNDVYTVDSAGDVVTELANEGTDTVNSSVSQQLGGNVENLTLTGSAAIDGLGNELGNRITGNAGDNLLEGGAGINTLRGEAGNDTLRASSTGTDYTTFDGGVGDDTIFGTQGGDTYLFDAGDGRDTITDTFGADRLRFGAGITQDDVQFSRIDDDMVMSIGMGTDSITIEDWYASSNNRIEITYFADGSRLTAAQIELLVTAMAAFAPQDASMSVFSDSGQRSPGELMLASPL